MSNTEELLRQYQGRIVPQNYNAGLVILSYIVSLVGAASTLELINRRTGFRGLFNHLLLLSSAVTMGGISIWCMHFIGNRAIDLASGEHQLHIVYSGGFTAVSFFVPIIVLLAAFVAVGSNSTVAWWRVAVGGILCGAAVCGMHYLGNASIRNYTCVYRPEYVVGSAIIAVVASSVALAMFFVFRAMWASSWWKRAISAIVLAGAVSGMHWCAAVGTQYRLIEIRPKGNEPSRSATVVVVICLSLGACFILAGSAIFRARAMRKSALKAQQIALGAAIFDKEGRILVDPDGFIPSTVITDSFLAKNHREGFGIGHHIFHWMFQASRNWNGILTLIGGMRRHIAQLPHSRDKEGRRGIELINEHGEMIQDYDVIFRELFCLAAAALAERVREPMESMGVLWDEILPTGVSSKRNRGQMQKNFHETTSTETNDDDNGGADLAEKGIQVWHEDIGRGSLMFLVRRVETDRDAERLVSAGYRFAELHQVSEIIRSSMQIQSPKFESKLREMAEYAGCQNTLLPGVHMGFFAIQARVNSFGFEVLVRKGARNLLPSVAMPVKTLQQWHIRFLTQFDGIPVTRLAQRLSDNEFESRSLEEKVFAGQLADTIKALRESVKEPLFDEAVLAPSIYRLPCPQGVAAMVTLQLVIPIHSVPTTTRCEFVPLNFFKVHQATDELHKAFLKSVRQEFGHTFKAGQHNDMGRHPMTLLNKLRRLEREELPDPFDLGGNMTGQRRLSLPDSVQSGSTINLCQRGGSSRSYSVDTADEPGACHQLPISPSFGGIMVFQEITIDIEDGQGKNSVYREGRGTAGTFIESCSVAREPSLASNIELRPMGHTHSAHSLTGSNSKGG